MIINTCVGIFKESVEKDKLLWKRLEEELEEPFVWLQEVEEELKKIKKKPILLPTTPGRKKRKGPLPPLFREDTSIAGGRQLRSRRNLDSILSTASNESCLDEKPRRGRTKKTVAVADTSNESICHNEKPVRASSMRARTKIRDIANILCPNKKRSEPDEPECVPEVKQDQKRKKACKQSIVDLTQDEDEPSGNNSQAETKESVKEEVDSPIPNQPTAPNKKISVDGSEKRSKEDDEKSNVAVQKNSEEVTIETVVESVSITKPTKKVLVKQEDILVSDSKIREELDKIDADTAPLVSEAETKPKRITRSKINKPLNNPKINADAAALRQKMEHDQNKLSQKENEKTVTSNLKPQGLECDNDLGKENIHAPTNKKEHRVTRSKVRVPKVILSSVNENTKLIGEQLEGVKEGEQLLQGRNVLSSKDVNSSAAKTNLSPYASNLRHVGQAAKAVNSSPKQVFSAYSKTPVKERIEAFEKQMGKLTEEVEEEPKENTDKPRRITRSKTRAVAVAQSLVRRSIKNALDTEMRRSVLSTTVNSTMDRNKEKIIEEADDEEDDNEEWASVCSFQSDSSFQSTSRDFLNTSQERSTNLKKTFLTNKFYGNRTTPKSQQRLWHFTPSKGGPGSSSSFRFVKGISDVSKLGSSSQKKTSMKTCTPLMTRKNNIVSGVESFLARPEVKPSQEDIIARKEEEIRRKKEKAEENQKRKEAFLQKQKEEKRKAWEAKMQKVQSIKAAQEKEREEARLRIEQKKIEAMKKKQQEEALRLAKLKEQEEEKNRQMAQALAAKKKEEEERKLQEMKEQAQVEKVKPVTKYVKQVTKVVDKNATFNVSSYDLTPAREDRVPLPLKDANNYGIEDVQSEDSSDEEGHPKKKIPSWVSSTEHYQVLKELETRAPEICKYFAPTRNFTIDLEKIFSAGDIRFRHRTSSAVWKTPPVKY